MTKKELSIYAGVRFYNLSTRPGAKRGTIYCLTIYEVTKKEPVNTKEKCFPALQTNAKLRKCKGSQKVYIILADLLRPC